MFQITNEDQTIMQKIKQLWEGSPEVRRLAADAQAKADAAANAERQKLIDENARLEKEIIDGTPSLVAARDKAEHEHIEGQKRLWEAVKKTRASLDHFKNGREMRIDHNKRLLRESSDSETIKSFRDQLERESERLRHNGREMVEGYRDVRGQRERIVVTNSEALSARMAAVRDAIHVCDEVLPLLPTDQLSLRINELWEALPDSSVLDDPKLAKQLEREQAEREAQAAAGYKDVGFGWLAIAGSK